MNSVNLKKSEIIHKDRKRNLYEDNIIFENEKFLKKYL